MNNKLFALICVTIAAVALSVVYAQSPTPLVTSATQTIPASITSNDSIQATMKSLQAIKTANEEILQKQQATLNALGELQKAADQLKIFAKRG